MTISAPILISKQRHGVSDVTGVGESGGRGTRAAAGPDMLDVRLTPGKTGEAVLSSSIQCYEGIESLCGQITFQHQQTHVGACLLVLSTIEESQEPL